jgi:hypothetical protein
MIQTLRIQKVGSGLFSNVVSILDVAPDGRMTGGLETIWP